MIKLVAAMDVSGGKDGNYIWIAIIICTEEQLNSILNHLKSKGIDLNDHKGTESRENIASELDFTKIPCFVGCYKIEQERLVKNFKTRKRKEGKFPSDRRVFEIFHQILFKEIRSKMEDFTTRHGISLLDVNFEIDGDCLKFVKCVNLSHTKAGYMHRLVDTIAWAINTGRAHIPGVFPLDLVKIIEAEMMKY